MPPRDNKFIGYSYLVNKSLEQVIEDENNNNNRKQPKVN